MSNSPFFVQENYISGLQCEAILQHLQLHTPDRDEKGQPLKYERSVPLEAGGNILYNLQRDRGALEEKYQAEVFGNPVLTFQQYWENPRVPAELHGCENSKYQRKKWTKIKDIDLVGYLWLKDFHNSVPLDPRHEVYGGKLEFPAFNFSLTPVRGTLVMFPASPHFVTATSHVLLGSLELIKIGLTLRKDGALWQYQPANYPGDYKSWFLPE